MYKERKYKPVCQGPEASWGELRRAEAAEAAPEGLLSRLRP